MQPVLNQQKLKALVYYIEVPIFVKFHHKPHIVGCRNFSCEGSTELSARNKRTNQKVSGVLERLASEYT